MDQHSWTQKWLSPFWPTVMPQCTPNMNNNDSWELENLRTSHFQSFLQVVMVRILSLRHQDSRWRRQTGRGFTFGWLIVDSEPTCQESERLLEGYWPAGVHISWSWQPDEWAGLMITWQAASKDVQHSYCNTYSMCGSTRWWLVWPLWQCMVQQCQTKILICSLPSTIYLHLDNHWVFAFFYREQCKGNITKIYAPTSCTFFFFFLPASFWSSRWPWTILVAFWTPQICTSCWMI